MRSLALAVTLASLTFVSACAAEEEPAPGATAPGSESSSESSTTEPSAPSSEPAPAGEPTVLTGVVGTPEDPDAFVITLTDEAGQPVTTLPAGDYTIQVSDPSDIHNFHFVGGSVDETTTVPELVETTFDVTLEPGQYTYICDPHPRMVGEISVT